MRMRFAGGVLVLTGASLLALPWLVDRRPPPAAQLVQTRAAPDPSWNTFTSVLRPLSQDEAATAERVWTRMAGLLESSALTCEGEMKRTLATGHEIAVALRAEVSRNGDRFSAALTIDRGAGRHTTYEAIGRGGEMQSLVIKDTTDEGAAPPIRIDVHSLRTSEAASLEIGDGQLRDLSLVVDAARARTWVPLGALEGLASRPLFAFASARSTGAAAASEHTPPRGRALMYVDAATLGVRTLRVFDGDDRLVRVYGNLLMDSPAAGRWTASFSVRSPQSGSESLFRLTDVRVR